MAQKFVTNLNLNQNQLINGKFEVLASDPSTNNFEGRLIYNSTEKTIKVYFETVVEGVTVASGWRKMLHGITSTGDQSEALTISEANGAVTIQPNLATSSFDGVMSAADKTKLDASTATETANTLVLRDGNGRFKAATPTADLDVANKGYVDAARTGLDVKASVKVATTAAITIASGLEAGVVIDGYTLVAGDRVLVKNQSTASENGIYIASVSGAPSRATDADNNAEVTPGMFTFVENGTLNADSGWVLITDGDITVGTTGLAFSLFSVAGNILAGDGLSKTGDVLNVNTGVGIEIHSDALRIKSDAAGDGLGYDAGVLSVTIGGSTGLAITSDAVGIKLDAAIAGLATTADGLKIKSDIAGDGLTYTAGVLSRNVIDLGQGSDDTTGTLPVDQGGTGATTESGARESLAVGGDTGTRTSTTPTLARKTTQVIGDASATSFAIVHNFNTRLVQTEVFDSATFDTVIADVVRTNVNTVTVSFSVAPDAGAYTVVITG
jgi:hypothetical protein